MISSELPELLGMSDRILVMHRGTIQAEFDAADATQERVLSAALGLARDAAQSRARQIRHAHRPAAALCRVVGADAAFPDASRTC